jgi:hypothetical protein
VEFLNLQTITSLFLLLLHLDYKEPRELPERQELLDLLGQPEQLELYLPFPEPLEPLELRLLFPELQEPQEPERLGPLDLLVLVLLL